MRLYSRLAGARLATGLLAVVLVLAVRGDAQTVQAASSPPPMPAEAKAILHFDLAKLGESDLFKAAEESFGMIERSTDKIETFKAALAAIGLDKAAENIKAFTLYSFASAEQPQEFAAIVSGDFGATTMSQLEEAYEPVRREVNGQWVMPVIQTPEIELVMSFLDENRLSFGTAPSVETVARSRGQEDSFLAAYKRTETARPIWGLINARAMIDTIMGEASAHSEEFKQIADNPALQSIKALGFSVDMGRDFFFELRAFTDDSESARLLADAFKGMVALGQLGASQTSDPDVAEFFRQIVAETERDSVYLSFALTELQIEKLKSGKDLFADLIPE